MKKFLLTLATVMVGLSASATSPFSVANRTKLNPLQSTDFRAVEITAPINNEPVIKSRAEAADEVFYTLAGDPYQALGLNGQKAGMQVAMAFQIEPEFLAGLSEAEITSISFYTGTDEQTNTNRCTKACVFITDNLQGDYLYSQDAVITTEPFAKVDIPLDSAFVIPTGVNKLYVGYYLTLTSATNYPAVADMMSHLNDRGGWMAARNTATAKWSWNNFASQVGFFTIGATIRSNDLPKNNVSVLEIVGQPAAYENETFAFDFVLQNNGANDITELTVEFGVEGEDPVTQDFTLDRPWGFNQLIAGSAAFKATKPNKSTNVNITVKAIDGEANLSDAPSASYPIVIVPAGKGFPRNVVIEEFTNIACIYCPVGYTAMETIREECTDGSIIPVCIHVNNNPGRDPMAAATFANVINTYCTQGVPSSTINRMESVYPIYDYLMEAVDGIKLLPGLAQVTAEAVLDRETATLTINTQTSFAFDYTDGDKNFILAYAITEDNVGPYNQQNGYAGYEGSVPGGWQNQPSTVSLIYNDVARQLDKYSGVSGSVPAEIKNGETYDFSHNLKLSSAVGDPDNINLVVYLLNRKSGIIENACTIKNVGNAELSGIETVVEDSSDAPVEYFNLQGLRVNEPSNGIFIRRQGNHVSKVYVK